jgi:hypothetical protein
MEANLFTKLYQSLKRILAYRPPAAPPQFVLGEEEYGTSRPARELRDRDLRADLAELQKMLRYGRRLGAARSCKRWYSSSLIGRRVFASLLSFIGLP